MIVSLQSQISFSFSSFLIIHLVAIFIRNLNVVAIVVFIQSKFILFALNTCSMTHAQCRQQYKCDNDTLELIWISTWTQPTDAKLFVTWQRTWLVIKKRCLTCVKWFPVTDEWQTQWTILWAHKWEKIIISFSFWFLCHRQWKYAPLFYAIINSMFCRYQRKKKEKRRDETAHSSNNDGNNNG